MICSVYRSRRREYTYLYLAPNQAPEDLPAELLAAFGEPEFVIEVELSPERKLASEPVETVLQNLQQQGYHLQLPPSNTQGAI